MCVYVSVNAIGHAKFHASEINITSVFDFVTHDSYTHTYAHNSSVKMCAYLSSHDLCKHTIRQSKRVYTFPHTIYVRVKS